jgi:hypothetical protein
MSFLEHLKPAIKEGKGWLFFNALGIGVYLMIESWIFAPRIAEETFNGIDQICFWETQEFPLLAFYFGVNVTWLLMRWQSAFSRNRLLLIWLLTCLVWGIVIACDPIAIKMIILIVPMMVKQAWNRA